MRKCAHSVNSSFVFSALCAKDPHIKCPVYTKTGMSLPMLEEFCGRKITKNPFGLSMQKCTCIVL